MKKVISLIIVIILILGGIYIYTNKDIIFEKKELTIKKNNKKKNISTGIFKNYYEQASSKVENMTLEEKIGQLFLVRYEKNDTTYFI